MTARAGGGVLSLSCLIEQDPGRAKIEASTGLRWGKELVPTLLRQPPTRVRLHAERFRLAGYEALAGDALVELDGPDVQITLREQPEWHGRLTLHEGHLRLASFGDTFEDAKATIEFQRGGVVRLDELSARSVRGRLAGSGQARLDRWQLASAEAELEIPSDAPIPLLVDGSHLGNVSAQVKLQARRSEDDQLGVEVQIPSLHLTLPEVSPKALQALAPAKHIRVGSRNRAGTIAAVALERPIPTDTAAAPTSSPPLRVAIHLGDVEVTRGDTLRVRLRGDPQLSLGGEARVAGPIELTEGMLDVQGKKFTIERGTITFPGGDPSNPDVVVRAAWLAPDGTNVYADFVGPLKSGKVTLRSDPPRPRNEIYKNLTTLAWRFYRNWSLETTVGDKGTTVLDVFWQYAY